MSGVALRTLPDTLEGVTAEINATQTKLVECLQDELVCAVCGCVFIDPRVLRCQHCFCLRCLYSTVARDRTQQLEVPCAYRCEETTTTRGDIRTLPKNHYITNTCILLRQHLIRRAQLLEKKHILLLKEETSTAALDSGAATSPLPADAPTSSEGQQEASGSHVADQLLHKMEKDLAAELYECEWCSCSSPLCEVCPYCWSRVCAECRGQFSDHQFLCLEQNQPGRRAPEGWLPGTASSAGAAVPLTVGRSDDASVPLTPTTEEEGTAVSHHHDASLPFLFTPFFVPTLVKECLVKQHRAPLQLSEIDVTNVTPVRLSVPEVAVQCQHHTTGFSFDYTVHPTFVTEEGVTMDINTSHWTTGDGKPSTTLSFLANATRLGELVLQDLHKLSTAASDVGLELSSAAHQAYVRRNKGFHMYALHVWVLVRSQCQIARDALLPHLERSRLLENIMGDLVTYRFQQTMSRASPPQKHVIYDECMAFLKAEIQMCRQLDQVMEGVDAACRGIYALLGRMRDAMKELAQPKVHRGEEHKKSHQSRLRFSVQLFHNREGEELHHQHHDRLPQPREQQAEVAASESQKTETVQTHAKVLRTGTPRRSSPSHHTPSITPHADPVLIDAAVTDTSFRGQVSEHQSTTQLLTDSFISILRCFMQARLWEWSLSNTCVRECGLGEQDRRDLLQTEETLQLLTDDLVRGVWNCGRLVYILEVQQDEAGPASSLDILMDKETLELLDVGAGNPIYEHNEVFEGLQALSQLRNHLLNVSSANVLATRNPDTQQELLKMMTSVLKTTMQHQMTVLRCVTGAEGAYERRLAAYLQTRQMTPTTGDMPPISEGTLLAVDILKMMQQHHDVLPTVAAPPTLGTGLGSGQSDGREQPPGVLRLSRLCPVGPGQKDAKELLTLPTLASTCETRGMMHALLNDFSRRDTALLSCQRYGEALVRVANGHSLDEGRSVFDMVQDNISGSGSAAAPAVATAAAAAASQVVERLPPPFFHVEEEPPHSTLPASSTADSREAVAPRTRITTLRGRADEGTDVSTPLPPPEGAGVSPPQLRDLSSSPPSAGTVEVNAADNAAGPTTISTTNASAPTLAGQSEVELVTTATSTRVLHPVHNELLFAADCANSTVEMAPVVASLADEAGSRKAAKLFKTTFQLPATTTSVNQRRIVYLPFYRGACTYKGVSTTFYMDAQTGAVYVNPQLLSSGGRRKYVLELLSSPLFFILFNSTLSILLRKRYKLEIFYK
jgi:hypothetical protein